MTVLLNRGQSTTLRHASHLTFWVHSLRPSMELEVWVAGQATILGLSTGYTDASWQCFYSYQLFLSFTERFNSFTLHSFTLPSETPLIFHTYHSPPFKIMTRTRRTSPHTHSPTTRRSRLSICNEDLDDNLRTIHDDYNDHQDDNSESDDKPLRRPSTNAMGKRLSHESFTSTLGELVTATQSSPM